MQFGVGSARRGWLTKDDVLNSRSLSELRQELAPPPLTIAFFCPGPAWGTVGGGGSDVLARVDTR